MAICAAVCCALCNGIAAVLQKIGADRRSLARSLDIGLLVRLLGNAPYAAGVVLDLAGWLLTVFAVRYAPLFLVETIIATNLVVTAFAEWAWRSHPLGRRDFTWIGVLLCGLAMVALTATPEKATHVYGGLAASIACAPAVLALLGAMFARSKTPTGTLALAVLSGLAFGGTSVVGRVLPLDKPLIQLVHDPFLFALIGYGVVGLLLFTLALQRGLATTANAGMTVAQTLVPATVGIVYLGDDVRAHLWALLILGSLCAVAGAAGLALSRDKVLRKTDD